MKTSFDLLEGGFSYNCFVISTGAPRNGEIYPEGFLHFIAFLPEITSMAE